MENRCLKLLDNCRGSRDFFWDPIFLIPCYPRVQRCTNQIHNIHAARFHKLWMLPWGTFPFLRVKTNCSLAVNNLGFFLKYMFQKVRLERRTSNNLPLLYLNWVSRVLNIQISKTQKKIASFTLKGHIVLFFHHLYSYALTRNDSEVLQKRTEETSEIQ